MSNIEITSNEMIDMYGFEKVIGESNTTPEYGSIGEIAVSSSGISYAGETPHEITPKGRSKNFQNHPA